MSLVKSKQRVADHGEVFTPSWMVEAMLDLVQGETERIDSRFLEPACGSGNFLVPILKRKLAAVELKYGKSDFEKRHFALLALMCCYGIELLADNIAECRAKLLQVFAEHLNLIGGATFIRRPRRCWRSTWCMATRFRCATMRASPSPLPNGATWVRAGFKGATSVSTSSPAWPSTPSKARCLRGMKSSRPPQAFRP